MTPNNSMQLTAFLAAAGAKRKAYFNKYGHSTFQSLSHCRARKVPVAFGMLERI